MWGINLFFDLSQVQKNKACFLCTQFYLQAKMWILFIEHFFALLWVLLLWYQYRQTPKMNKEHALTWLNITWLHRGRLRAISRAELRSELQVPDYFSSPLSPREKLPGSQKIMWNQEKRPLNNLIVNSNGSQAFQLPSSSCFWFSFL